MELKDADGWVLGSGRDGYITVDIGVELVYLLE
jgi:hypothetical protein